MVNIFKHCYDRTGRCLETLYWRKLINEFGTGQIPPSFLALMAIDKYFVNYNDQATNYRTVLLLL